MKKKLKPFQNINKNPQCFLGIKEIASVNWVIQVCLTLSQPTLQPTTTTTIYKQQNIRLQIFVKLSSPLGLVSANLTRDSASP